MAKNRPSNLPAEPRLTPRLSELNNPTLVDVEGGLNAGGSNSNADGVHTGHYNLNAEYPGSWYRQLNLENLMGQHVGIGQSAPEDAVLVQGVQCRYIQASADIPPAGTDPATGLINPTGQFVPAGSWLWALEGIPLATRVIDDQTPRITADGFYRVAAI